MFPRLPIKSLLHQLDTKYRTTRDTALQDEHYSRCVKGMATVAMVGKAMAGHLMLEGGE